MGPYTRRLQNIHEGYTEHSISFGSLSQEISLFVPVKDRDYNRNDGFDLADVLPGNIAANAVPDRVVFTRKISTDGMAGCRYVSTNNVDCELTTLIL